MTPTAPTILAASGLVLWTLALLILLVAARSAITLATGKPADGYDPAGTDLGPFMQRLTRAHANACEFAPLPLALLLLAIAVEGTDVTDPLAPWMLGLRIGQSLVHLASATASAVIVHFAAFFLPQAAITAHWGLRLAAGVL